MNYIKQINTFYELLPTNPISANSQVLYFALLNINNRCNWKKDFSVANSTLMSLTSLSMSALQRARNGLIQKGYIEYKKGKGNNSGTYLIVNFEQQSEQQSEQQIEQQSEQQTDNKVNTLNKLNKTKQYIDHFDLTWKKYPNKQGKAKALEYYLQWIKGRKINGITRKLTDKEMYYAVLKYSQECEKKQIEQQFIKHGDTFFNKAILDYVELENE